DCTTGKTQQLTRTTDIETNPRFLADGRRIAFTRANNLYVQSLDSGMLVQMTDIRTPGAPVPMAPPTGGRGGGRGLGLPPETPPLPSGKAPKGPDSQEYLKKQQKELLEAIRDRVSRREEDEARRKRDYPRKPFTLQARQTVLSLQLSPDEKYVVAS